MLQAWGRGPFDNLLAEVGSSGIRATLSRDTPEGPDFFRAIDTVKKRAQREKSYAPLEAGADVAASDDPTGRAALGHIGFDVFSGPARVDAGGEGCAVERHRVPGSQQQAGGLLRRKPKAHQTKCDDLAAGVRQRSSAVDGIPA